MRDASIAIDYLTGRRSGRDRPAAIGRKFGPDGAVLRTPGNTFLCHVDPDSEAHRCLARAQAVLKTGRLADAFAFLPQESFHMTVFQGVIDTERERGLWPRHMPLDAPVHAVTEDFRGRLEGLSLRDGFRIRTHGLFGGFSVTVAGADGVEEAALREARETLSKALDLRAPDHGSYGFHITFGYLLRWLDPQEAREVVDLSKVAAAKLPDEIALGPVEFCTFDDMHRFDPVMKIGT